MDFSLYEFNFVSNIIFPKKEGAIQIQHYRLVCLFNENFNIAQVGTNQTKTIDHNVIPT
jgi:hypothetical protein